MTYHYDLRPTTRCLLPTTYSLLTSNYYPTTILRLSYYDHLPTKASPLLHAVSASRQVWSQTAQTTDAHVDELLARVEVSGGHTRS